MKFFKKRPKTEDLDKVPLFSLRSFGHRYPSLDKIQKLNVPAISSTLRRRPRSRTPRRSDRHETKTSTQLLDREIITGNPDLTVQSLYTKKDPQSSNGVFAVLGVNFLLDSCHFRRKYGKGSRKRVHSLTTFESGDPPGVIRHPPTLMQLCLLRLNYRPPRGSKTRLEITYLSNTDTGDSYQGPFRSGVDLTPPLFYGYLP